LTFAHIDEIVNDMCAPQILLDAVLIAIKANWWKMILALKYVFDPSDDKQLPNFETTFDISLPLSLIVDYTSTFKECVAWSGTREWIDTIPVTDPVFEIDAVLNHTIRSNNMTIIDHQLQKGIVTAELQYYINVKYSRRSIISNYVKFDIVEKIHTPLDFHTILDIAFHICDNKYFTAIVDRAIADKTFRQFLDHPNYQNSIVRLLLMFGERKYLDLLQSFFDNFDWLSADNDTLINTIYLIRDTGFTRYCIGLMPSNILSKNDTYGRHYFLPVSLVQTITEKLRN
jgi:hypothetical protein